MRAKYAAVAAVASLALASGLFGLSFLDLAEDAHPAAATAYHAGTAYGFLLALISAAAAISLSRDGLPRWLAYSGTVLGVAGVVISLGLLQVFAGLCGFGVFWGNCNP
jgi:hypothetical protein